LCYSPQSLSSNRPAALLHFAHPFSLYGGAACTNGNALRQALATSWEYRITPSLHLGVLSYHQLPAGNIMSYTPPSKALHIALSSCWDQDLVTFPLFLSETWVLRVQHFLLCWPAVSISASCWRCKYSDEEVSSFFSLACALGRKCKISVAESIQMKLPAIHHSENVCMFFPHVLNLAFSEGHNIKIVLPHIFYETGNQLTSGRDAVGYSVHLPQFYFFPLWIYPNEIVRNSIC